MQKKNIIIAISIAVIFFVLGAAANVVREIGSGDANCAIKDSDNTFAAGWEAAKQRLVKNGFVQDFNDEVFEVEGVVLSIAGNELTVKISPVEVLADPALDERVVEIGAETKLYGYLPKPEEVYNQEIEEFKIASKNFSGSDFNDMPLKPSEFEIKEIEIGSLKKGMELEIMANINIKNEKTFLADKITVRNEFK